MSKANHRVHREILCSLRSGSDHTRGRIRRTAMIRGDEDIAEGLLNAFRLEKGAHAFYEAASERVQDRSAVEMFRKLADVEERHMHDVYDLYHAFIGDRGPVPFPEFKEKMPAEYTESGKTIEAALSDVQGRFFMDAKEVLRVALQEESSALNLYTRMAERSEDPGTAALYRQLSGEEEEHKSMIEKTLKGL